MDLDAQAVEHAFFSSVRVEPQLNMRLNFPRLERRTHNCDGVFIHYSVLGAAKSYTLEKCVDFAASAPMCEFGEVGAARCIRKRWSSSGGEGDGQRGGGASGICSCELSNERPTLFLLAWRSPRNRRQKYTQELQHGVLILASFDSFSKFKFNTINLISKFN